MEYPLAVLLAAQDVVDHVKIEDLKIEESRLSFKTQKGKTVVFELRNGDDKKSKAWWMLFQGSEINPEITLCKWLLFQNVIKGISSAFLKKEAEEVWNLRYLFSHSVSKYTTIENLDLVHKNMEVGVAFGEGYTVEEFVGKYILVRTPSGFERETNSKTCNCKQFNEVNKQQKDCLHIKIADVYLSNRQKLLELKVASQIS